MGQKNWTSNDKMLQAKWLAALVALCTAAGVSIGKTYCSSTSAGGQSTEQRIAELQKEVERQKKLRAQERSGRTNAERVRAIALSL